MQRSFSEKSVPFFDRIGRYLHLLRCARNPDCCAVHIRCPFDNLGDIMVADAITEMLAPLRLLTLGPSRSVRGLDRIYPLRKITKYACLGGGTLIFAPPGIGWLESVAFFDERVQSLCTFGTGVIDPQFRAHLHATRPNAFTIDDDTKRAWIRRLKSYAHISVRGVESQRILNESGLGDVEVIGDPALYYADSSLLPRRAATLRVGVNVSEYSDFWGNCQKTVVEELTSVIRKLSARGLSITLFPTQSADVTLSRKIAADLGVPAITVKTSYDSPRSFVAELREMDLFIGTKLHSVVCAFCAYVPAIMIGYQPKCYDFMKTMGFEDYWIRSDRVTSHAIVALVDDLLRDPSAIRERQWNAVQSYRHNMLNFRDRVMTSVGLTPTVHSPNGDNGLRQRAGETDGLLLAGVATERHSVN